ncbi:MAG: mechanosensitive ion channel, partial [Solobacterium sp.]|nr:mechanosensitive ion channel [Solobacterium sp.]
ILTILLGFTGILLFISLLMASQSNLARNSLEEEMKDNSSYICDAFGSYEFRDDIIRLWSDGVHESFLRMIMLNAQDHPELLKSQDFLTELNSGINARDILVIDKEGNVIASSVGFYKDLKDPVYAPLLKTFETFQMERAVIYPYSPQAMDERIASLNDMANSQLIEIEQKEAENSSESSETGEHEEDLLKNEVFYNFSNPFPIFYSLSIGGDLACVINDYGEAQLAYENMTNAWNYTLKNEVIGSGGFAFVWAADTGEILYYPDSSFQNRNISTLGLNMNDIHDGTFVTQNVNGTSMYLYPVYFKDQNAWVVCGVPNDELSALGKQVTYLMWFIFAVLAADLAYYAVLLLKQKNRVIEENYHPVLRQQKESGRKVKLLTFTVFCTVAVLFSSFYLQTFYLMSSWSKTSTAQLSKIQTEQKHDENILLEIKDLYQKSAEKLVKLAEWYLEKHPDYISPEKLDLLTSILDLDTLWVTDEYGMTIAASSSYLAPSAGVTQETEQTASDSNAETRPSDSSSALPKKTSISVPSRTENGNIAGYVNGEYGNGLLGVMLGKNTLSDTLKSVQPGEGAFVFTVDQEKKKFTWHPDSSFIGKNALDYGIKETDLQDNLCQYIQMNRDTYYAVTGQYNTDIIFFAIRKDNLLSQRLPLTLTAAMFAFFILLLIGICVYTCPETEYDTEVENPEKERTAGKTAEFKVFRNLASAMAGMAAVLLLIRYATPGSSDDSMFGYVLSGNWEHGLNVFALTASLIIILEGGLGLFLLRWLTNIMTTMLATRARTVIRMIASLVSYAGGFVILYRCLVYLGMDPTALMTSAGIVSVVIGIGANSLVGDIIAGIFLLIEGNIQVGDMISVNGFRGIVEELGIRMTKIYDVDSEDIKIIPNKEVQNVVHMSAHPANLFLEYQICYEEDLERVEKLLIEELKKPEGRIPEMIGDLVYLGVRRLGDSGVALLVRARCHEAFRPRVTRAVNRKVYMMFKRNGIEVPFPQLTIHTGDDQNNPKE